jgi:urea transport system substrate-binding protein
MIPIILVFALLLVILTLTGGAAYIRLLRRGAGGLLVVGLVMAVALAVVWYWIVGVQSCAPDCIGANFLRRDLRGFDLHDVKLVGANLREANLSDANLSGADLSSADLTRSNLENADLRGATLFGADLTGATLTGAKLDGANFSGSVLNEAILTGVDLRAATLAGVWFRGAELVDANMADVVLTTTDLSDAKLNGANLANANLSGSTMSRADLSGARLSGVNLSGSWLNRASLIGADLTKADLSGVGLIGANLASADLTESNLIGTVLIGVDLKGATLKAANLRNARLNRSQLIEEDFADEVIAELNELQRSRLLVDARLDGVSFDAQTIWPDEQIAEQLQPPAPSVSAAQAGETIKVGILHSLSGPMATSELAVRDATLMAMAEINNNGGILGKQLQPVVMDGASDPAMFAESARKLLEKDQVAVVFGGWTIDSRKAMLPVFEELNGLLFYPVRYEGLESSPNIFYTGAEPTQQIIPAVSYLLSQGHTSFFLLGSDYVFPRTANAIVKAQLGTVNATIADEVYAPLDAVDFTKVISQVQITKPSVIFSTLNGDSNVAFFHQLWDAGYTASNLPVMSVSVTEEEARSIGAEWISGHMTAWNYYQTVNTAENQIFVSAYKAAYGEDRVTSDPIEAGYFGVYLWKAMVEEAGSTETAAVRAAAEQGNITFQAPEGTVRIDGENHHTYKTVRIGVVRDDGMIDAVLTSDQPLKPDPYLTQYTWATPLVEALQKQQNEAAPQ